MTPTQTADTQELLAVANRASAILAGMLHERAITTNPAAFIEDTTMVSNELTQELSYEFSFLGEEVQVFLDIAEPISGEKPGQWHPHISIEHQRKHADAYLAFDEPVLNLSE